MVKPDGVERKLIGDIVKRFENKGFTLKEAKFFTVSEKIAKQHYVEHKDKPFFNELIDFLRSGPVFAMVWEGENVVSISRKMIGSTDPLKSEPGTIRGDFSHSKASNVVHGSDSVSSAKREISLWFSHIK